jgi:hypothetical protein
MAQLSTYTLQQYIQQQTAIGQTDKAETTTSRAKGGTTRLQDGGRRRVLVHRYVIAGADLFEDGEELIDFVRREAVYAARPRSRNTAKSTAH